MVGCRPTVFSCLPTLLFVADAALGQEIRAVEFVTTARIATLHTGEARITSKTAEPHAAPKRYRENGRWNGGFSNRSAGKEMVG